MGVEIGAGECSEIETSSLHQTQLSGNLPSFLPENGNRSASLRNDVKVQKPSYSHSNMQPPELFRLR